MKTLTLDDNDLFVCGDRIYIVYYDEELQECFPIEVDIWGDYETGLQVFGLNGKERVYFTEEINDKVEKIFKAVHGEPNYQAMDARADAAWLGHTF